MKAFFMASLALLLTACSTAPTTIQHAPKTDLQLKQVSVDVASHIDEAVRWGGKIIEVNNEQNYTQIQLIQFPLNRYGRPVESDDSQGRFLVKSDAFLDPAIFTTGSMLTVYGRIIDKKLIKVDQRTLTLPVVTIIDSQRWPANSASGRPYNPKHDWPFVGFGYYATGSYSP
ncbi:Slp family lipoprotein [Methylophaga sp. OBS1]|uniref:Slp family lipoprotein n=1 Tax=Methylophaga sp. OBS1 TaxID=2991933 RepID=UPI002257CCFD|nr:Slp family lipoprotein [Methylophaga sp. OBS1]MCX4193639.1 Slp family lipoprotein [Methylophaga sp. OBS1]